MRRFVAAGAAVSIAMLAALPARADLVAEVNRIRASGCDGRAKAPLLQPQRRLDAAAGLLAKGVALEDAARRAGYRPAASAFVRIANPGDDRALATVLRQRFCREVMDPRYRDIGVHRRGAERWLVLAAAVSAPPAADAERISKRVLALVNEARSRARRCGRERYGAAGPLQLADALTRAARVHAQDMARHGFLDHRGSDGSSAGDRLQKTGYARRLVGENVAAGPMTAEEAVQGWLDSPSHCANLMDPRFVHMGVAYAASRTGTHGVYWAQVFAAPR